MNFEKKGLNLYLQKMSKHEVRLDNLDYNSMTEFAIADLSLFMFLMSTKNLTVTVILEQNVTKIP